MFATTHAKVDIQLHQPSSTATGSTHKCLGVQVLAARLSDHNQVICFF